MCSDAFHSQRLQEHASDPERTGVRVLRVRRLGRCWEACHFAARHRLRSDRSARDGRARIERGRPIDVFRALANGFLQPPRARNVERLREIARLGHDIGLHYDETQYEDGDDAIAAIQREADTLGGALGLPIECVSMHRPSKASLEAQWSIPGIVNSYSSEFFQGFEYASDSRRRWRKPILDMIESGKYPRLHILTHPFWYGGTEASLEESLRRFIERAGADRWAASIATLPGSTPCSALRTSFRPPRFPAQ